ncbi:hypothetical protein COLSTE_01600 [Collinsella stercoris DSM 13279]|uniref:Uncharacterized protein n=1 Tax=Collinsella stercoris DSM 13279 TaxID=445975 RepID=B6GBY1_9ACTN|nr:hypothetical protein COLSTE_01600 [Collinsella stercoris DSM 13279]
MRNRPFEISRFVSKGRLRTKIAMIMCFTIGLKDTARFQSSGYAHEVYSCQHRALRLFMYLSVISMTGFDFG